MADKIVDVEQMPIYGLMMNLAWDVAKHTRSFGPDFRWLRVQILRSSESVIANIAEGFYSQYSTEYMQGLYRARREARETIAHLRYSIGVEQLQQAEVDGLIARYEKALVQLSLLISSIENKIAEKGKGKAMPSMIRDNYEEYSSFIEDKVVE